MDAAAGAARQFAEARIAGAQALWAEFNELFLSKWVPEPRELFPDDSWAPTIAAVVVANVVLLILFPKGRRLIFNIVETILACILVFVLVCVVIGLPIGATYLTYKAVGYVASSVTALPAVAALLERLRATAGKNA